MLTLDNKIVESEYPSIKRYFSPEPTVKENLIKPFEFRDDSFAQHRRLK